MRRVFSNSVWAKIKGLVPQGIKNAAVRYMLFSDRTSRRAFRGAYQPNGLITLKLRALEGKPLLIRRGTDDPYVLRGTFTWSEQLPPADLRPRLIVDVGAHIGASMALFASRFPEAQIVGLEPDPENAKLCRHNIVPWADRCQLIEAAAWTEDGTVCLATGRSNSTHSVDRSGRDVDAVRVSTLVDRYGPIDYMKLDIEGGEQALLAADPAWATAVACINVEVHSPYTLERCCKDLAQLGYTTSLRPAPRQPCVIGRRPAR